MSGKKWGEGKRERRTERGKREEENEKVWLHPSYAESMHYVPT
jgi:hypothetical protein